MHIKIALSIIGLIAQWMPAPTEALQPPSEMPIYLAQIRPIEELKLPEIKPAAKLAMAGFSFLPMGSRPNSYAPNNCTWGAASMKPNVPESWGNANTWDDSALVAGITVSATPIVGAVAQTDRGFYGHVAVVDAVEPSGQAEITEMNYDNAGGVRTRLAAPGEFVYIWI